MIHFFNYPPCISWGLWRMTASVLGLGRGYPEQRMRRLAVFLGRHSGGGLPAFDSILQPHIERKTNASPRVSTILWLWHFLETYQPRRLIEFGTGFTTCFFAEYAKRYPERNVEILSLEDHEDFFNFQADYLQKHALAETVQLSHAPLQESPGPPSLRQYDPAPITAAVEMGGLFDLALVDGPVAIAEGGYGRAGSLEQAINCVRPGGWVWLHDAERSEEFGMIQEQICRSTPKVSAVGMVPEISSLAVLKRCETAR